jgi:hypothetical protein
MSDALTFALGVAPKVVAVVVSAVFLDSLRYKFTNHPKTQEIFGRLDRWAGSHGLAGLFARTGVFGQYVIGAAELTASAVLLLGAFVSPYRFVLPLGALAGLAVMTGAVSFHLFTPLGTDPNKDGGGLFKAACLVWVLCLSLLFLNFDDVALLSQRVGAFVAPA